MTPSGTALDHERGGQDGAGVDASRRRAGVLRCVAATGQGGGEVPDVHDPLLDDGLAPGPAAVGRKDIADRRRGGQGAVVGHEAGLVAFAHPDRRVPGIAETSGRAGDAAEDPGERIRCADSRRVLAERARPQRRFFT